MKGLQPSMQRVTVKSNVLMIFELFELSLCQVTVCHKLVSETTGSVNAEGSVLV